MRATILAGLFATAITAASCGDDPEPTDPAAEAAAVGTYTLTSVNEAALPFKYGQNDSTRFDITSGRIVLQANKDFTDETTFAESRLSDGAPIGEPAVQRYLGTWSIRRDSLRLVYPGLGTEMAGLTSTTITLSAGTLSLTYTK